MHSIFVHARRLAGLAMVPALLSAQGTPGFRVIRETDARRTVGPARDFEGRPRQQPATMPILVGIWYPAISPTAGSPVTLADYYVLSTDAPDASVGGPAFDAARADAKNFGQFALGLSISDSAADAFLRQPMRARKDAPPASGRFPVVIAGTDGALGSRASLYEALAARGMVVVAAPSRRALAAVQASNAGLATATRLQDLEFLTGYAASLPFVDIARLAVLGVNFDGMAALLYEMKNMRAAAVVTIDGWEGKRGLVGTVRESMHYDPLRFRIPYFTVQQDERNVPETLAQDTSLFDALRYGWRERVVLNGVSHAHLAGYGAYYPGISDSAREGNEWLVRRVADVLTSAFANATPRPASTPLISAHNQAEALPAVPYAEEVETIVMAPDGPRRLAEVFRTARGRDPEVQLFTQSAINLFAFRMRAMQRPAEAIALLELGTEARPASAGAYNDLGNALLQGGDTTRAIRSFERALELVPGDSALTDADRVQWRQVLSAKITRLRGSMSGEA